MFKDVFDAALLRLFKFKDAVTTWRNGEIVKLIKKVRDTRPKCSSQKRHLLTGAGQARPSAAENFSRFDLGHS